MSTPERLSCAEVEPLLPAIADGQLDAEQAPDVFAHLAGCPACQASLALHDLCELALAGERRPARDPERVVHYHLPWPVAASAALAALLVLAWGLYRYQEAAPAAQPALAAEQVVIQRVIPPSAPGQPTLLLVRQGDTTFIVDPRQLDTAPSAFSAGTPVSLPVGNRR